jgi:hypothetical protein
MFHVGLLHETMKNELGKDMKNTMLHAFSILQYQILVCYTVTVTIATDPGL